MVPGKLTINQTEEELTVSLNDDEYTYDGGSHYNENTATTNAASGTTTIEFSKDGAAWTENLASLTATNVADSFTIQVRATNLNYKNTATDTATLTINPAEVKITAKSESFTYDGNAHSNAGYDVTGLVGNDKITATVTGSITFPSESPVDNVVASYEFTSGTAGNYTVSTANGQLTMTAASVAITIKAADDSKTYDGSALTNGAVTVTSGTLLTGDELVAEATGSATNVADTATGNNPIAAGYKIMHAKEDVTANYVITAEAGTLTIKPATLTITADSDSKVYDGTTLTKDSYTHTDLVKGDSISSVTVSGSQTLVGSSANVPSDAKIANAEGKDATANYTITYANGTLTVTDGTENPDGPQVKDGLVVKKIAQGDAAANTSAALYGVGDEVTFKITATNIYDEAKTIKLSEIEGVTLAKSEFTNVAKGESIETTATYTIKEADVLKGEFKNTVTATIDKLTKKASATVDTEGLDTTLTVKKEVTKAPADGKAFKLGETIEYKITVTNEGNVSYNNVKVEDELVGLSETIKVLAVGESKTFTVSYTVTEADILAGSVTNKAVAAADPIDDPDNPNEPKTPTGEDEITTGDEGTPDDPNDPPVPPIEDKNGHLTISKETTSTPKDKNGYVLDETITYKITVTNDGNLTITDIKVTDELTGNVGDKAWTIASLAPNATQEFTASYTVTDADVKNGNVVNNAAATGTSPDPDKPEVPVTPGTKEEPTFKPEEPAPATEKTVIYYTNYPIASMTDEASEEITVTEGYKVEAFKTFFENTPVGYMFNGWKDIKTGKTYYVGDLLMAIQGAASGSAASSSKGSGVDGQANVATTSELTDADFVLYAQWKAVKDKDEPTEDTEEPIDDGDTPLAPAEETEEPIDDGDTPLAPAEEEPDEPIDEEATPFSPYTGDDRHTVVWSIISLLSLAGIAVVARKRKEE